MHNLKSLTKTHIFQGTITELVVHSLTHTVLKIYTERKINTTQVVQNNPVISENSCMCLKITNPNLSNEFQYTMILVITISENFLHFEIEDVHDCHLNNKRNCSDCKDSLQGIKKQVIIKGSMKL